MNMKPEKRIFAGTVKIETRADGDNAKIIRGYAAVFDKLSENLGGFREKIKPGAFDGVLGDDVRGLFNHDSNIILGRVSAGTLKVMIDSGGLGYEIIPPDTQAARDLAVSIARGDVRESSFAFQVEDDQWDEDEDGRVIRTITKFKSLIDVSPVTYAAYPDATTALRSTEAAVQSLEAWKKEKSKPQSPDYRHLLRKHNLRLEEING